MSLKNQPEAPRRVEIIRRVSQAGIAPPPTQAKSADSPSARRQQMLSKQDRILGVMTNSPQHLPPKRRFDLDCDPYSSSIDWDEEEELGHGVQDSWFDLDVVEEAPEDHAGYDDESGYVAEGGDAALDEEEDHGAAEFICDGPQVDVVAWLWERVPEGYEHQGHLLPPIDELFA